MKKLAFVKDAFEQYNNWATENKKIQIKIAELIKAISRNPFSGIGKPEPLKHELKGLWSRRITDEHRLIYEIKDDEIIIHSCRFHYEK